MKKSYKSAQWVVQRNLTSGSDFEGIKASCVKNGIEFIGIDIIPFSPTLPPFERSRPSIIYGSTTFNNIALADPDLRRGLFFDEASFSIENYIEKWGSSMLNYGASVTTFEALIDTGDYKADSLLFIRPNDDSKSFSGEVKRFDQIKDWYQQLKVVDNTNLSFESKIVVSSPYNIQYEWRLWIVNKKVIAASRYREYFKLSKQEGCPEAVVSFAEMRCQQYTPHDVFVMDVCLCGDEYFIVECGCVNAAGFYNGNIESIVVNVTDYFLSKV